MQLVTTLAVIISMTGTLLHHALNMQAFFLLHQQFFITFAVQSGALHRFRENRIKAALFRSIEIPLCIQHLSKSGRISFGQGKVDAHAPNDLSGVFQRAACIRPKFCIFVIFQQVLASDTMQSILGVSLELY